MAFFRRRARASPRLSATRVGRHAKGIRVRRRRSVPPDHRRSRLSRRRQQRAAAHAAAGLQRPQRRARPGHPRDARTHSNVSGRSASSNTSSAASTTRSRKSCVRSSRWSASRCSRWPSKRGSRAIRASRNSAENTAAERQLQLDMMPPDLAGQVRGLQNYDFKSAEAQQKFEELMEQLREQMMQQMLNQMSDAMQNMSPEDMQRMKDMLNELNQMLDQRARGSRARLRRVHGALRRLLPRESADARRVARSAGPAHGGDAGDVEFDDARAARAAAAAVRHDDGRHGPALAGRPARAEPAQHVPADGLGSRLPVPRRQPASASARPWR